MEELEIERRFMLSGFPIIPDELKEKAKKSIIIQYYTKDRLRYRKDICDTIGKTTYDVTFKKRVGHGVNNEKIQIITESEWDRNRSKLERMITKSRVSVIIGEVKWEIDEFLNGMIIAEAEVPSIDFNLAIPDFIKDVMVSDVTGDKSLSNYSLAKVLEQ